MYSRPLPSAKKPMPGTYATCAFTARGCMSLASSPCGSFSQT
jgi:hypothetical protein